MPNTVYGPYSGINVVNGSTPANATWGNLVQTQSSIALHGWNPDLFTPFIFSGMVATKDGTVANQLDVTAGKAYIQMTDGTLGLIVTIPSTPGQFVTSSPSTTYHLYLQPDGTWYWSTANAPQTNSLAIATVTTDASSNILAVTDARTLTTQLLSGITSPAGKLQFNTGLIITQNTSGSPSFLRLLSGNNPLYYYDLLLDFTTGKLVLFDGKNGANMLSGTSTGLTMPALTLTGGTPALLVTNGIQVGSLSSDGGKITSDGAGNLFGNIGGGPLQAFATSTTMPGPPTKLTQVTVPTAGVYLFWIYLVGTMVDNTFPPAMTAYGYHNSSAITGQSNPTAAAQATSANTWGATLAWCYKVTCAANDTLELWYNGTAASGINVSGQAIAQYLHS